MENLINAKIKELTENGKLDEIVTKEATKFMQSMVSDVLCTYSDVGKAFKEKLKVSVLANLERLDFVQYSKTLTDLMESELNKSIIAVGIEPAKKMIQEFVGSLEKKEWKLSEIINKFKEEEVLPDEHGESGEIAFFHEKSSYGTWHIGFDKEEGGKSDRMYNCKYRLMIDDKTNKLYSPTVEGIGLHPISEMGLHGFNLFLFKLYASECTIECDVNNVDVEWSTYE